MWKSSTAAAAKTAPPPRRRWAAVLSPSRPKKTASGRGDPGRVSVETATEQEDHGDGDRVHDEQSEMHTARRLAEGRQQGSVCYIRARRLHAVDVLVWRDTAEDQLSGVGVLSLVALEGNVEQAPTRTRGEHQNQHQRGPDQNAGTDHHSPGPWTADARVYHPLGTRVALRWRRRTTRP